LEQGLALGEDVCFACARAQTLVVKNVMAELNHIAVVLFIYKLSLLCAQGLLLL